jgi:hypothetical protein
MPTTQTAPAARAFAANFAALPVDFRDAHKRPIGGRVTHARVSAWLNGVHKGVEVACVNYLAMAEVAAARGDYDAVTVLLDEVAPYRAVMADLDALIVRK